MDERDERGGKPEAGAAKPEGRVEGGHGRLWARARERRRERERERERERAGRSYSYRETGGGYGGYGGTADRDPWAPDEGRFGGGFSGYGGRPRGGGPYPGERFGPRVYRGASRGLSFEEGEERAPAGPRWADELQAERIGPGAYRRGGTWTGGRPGRGRGPLH